MHLIKPIISIETTILTKPIAVKKLSPIAQRALREQASLEFI
jgi:hypothetical protein